MKCPRCQHENRPTAKFCEDCANPLNGASPPPESNAHLATEVETLSSALTESLAQQTATSEILRVISQSPTDVRPVFETIVRNAVQLCDAVTSGAFRFDGGLIYFEAEYYKPALADVEARFETFRRRFPMSPSREAIAARVILDCAVVHISDIANDPETPEASREVALAVGYRSILSVPMLRDGRPIGAISVARATRGYFSDHHVALLKTFADQAVIAIENVRLFTELQEKNRALTEALEQQTATAEILRVISSSPTDLQPVMDAVAENAARVCGATDATIRLIEGDIMRVASRFGAISPVAPEVIPVDRDSHTGRAIVERRTIHIEDIRRLPETEFPRIMRENQRTVLATPLMRKGEPIGAILIRRVEVHPFTDKQIELLQTFADQAVIAIENVRLFNELEARNSQLTQALEQQTATSDILRVISRSPTDTQPVFEVIVSSAQRLVGAYSTSLLRLVEGELHLAASSTTTPAGDKALRAMYPLRLTQAPLLAQAIADREPFLIEDTETDPRITPLAREVARQRGSRSTLQLPLVHGDRVIG